MLTLTRDRTERARAFVISHGSPLAQAQLAFALDGSPISSEHIADFFKDQRPDGSWSPFWNPQASSIDATTYKLTQARAMGLLEDQRPPIQRALAFLRNQQYPNGHWDEDARWSESAPPWAKPGEQKSVLYLTASCGHTLAALKTYQHCAQMASDYLLAYLDDAGTLPSFTHTHWLAACLWYQLQHKEPAERVFATLRQRLNDDFSPGNLVWLVSSMQDAGIPITHPLLHTALNQLTRVQREDGAWNSDDDPQFDAQTTTEALLALQRAGRLES